MQVHGILISGKGQRRWLQGVRDPAQTIAVLEISMQLKRAWHLTEPLLPLSRNLSNNWDAIINVLALDAAGNTVAVLYDLDPLVPPYQAIGRLVSGAQWLETLSQAQLEQLARTFWQDEEANLLQVHREVFEAERAAPVPESPHALQLNRRQRVLLLSTRPLETLMSLGRYLHRKGIEVSWLRVSHFKNSEGDDLLLLEPPPTLLEAPRPEAVTTALGEKRVLGDATDFLSSLPRP